MSIPKLKPKTLRQRILDRMRVLALQEEPATERYKAYISSDPKNMQYDLQARHKRSLEGLEDVTPTIISIDRHESGEGYYITLTNNKDFNRLIDKPLMDTIRDTLRDYVRIEDLEILTCKIYNILEHEKEYKQ